MARMDWDLEDVDVIYSGIKCGMRGIQRKLTKMGNTTGNTKLKQINY